MKNLSHFSLISLYLLGFSTLSFASFLNDPIEWVCPEEYEGFIRHPYDCSLFYVCYIGFNPILHYCPQNQYFNPITEKCDNPSNVPDCQGGSPPPTTVAPTTTQASTTTQVPTTTQVSTPPTDPISWVCPEGYHGLIRHPYDCRSFYLCNVQETPYLLECSSGLYFNPETHSCDFPENVPDCRGGSPPPPTTTPISTTTRNPINWICPENYQGLIRHPYNCHLFYLCHVDPTPYLLECAPDLYFNPETETCDFPENVPDCQEGTPPPFTPTPRPSLTAIRQY